MLAAEIVPSKQNKRSDESCTGPAALEWVRVCTLKDVASPRNGETHFWPVLMDGHDY